MILTEPANRLTTRVPSPAAPLPAPAPAATAAPAAPAVDLAECRWETVACSPDREWINRAERWGWPEPISDAVVAALLQKTVGVTVRADGIKLTIGKEKCHFWAEDSQLVQQAIHGPFEALAKFDPDDLSCLHLFRHVGQDNALQYVETVARYVPPHMLDAEAQARVLAAKRRQIRFVLDELQELHAEDTQRASARDLSNAEKIQRVRTFPLGAAEPSPAPATTRGAAEATAATRGSSHLEPAQREADSAADTGLPRVARGGDQPRRFDLTEPEPDEPFAAAVPPRASAPLPNQRGSGSPNGEAAPAAESSATPLPDTAARMLAAQAAARAQVAAAPQRAADARAQRHRTQADLLD